MRVRGSFLLLDQTKKRKKIRWKKGKEKKRKEKKKRKERRKRKERKKGKKREEKKKEEEKSVSGGERGKKGKGLQFPVF